jgi:hypothetical protein
MNHQKSMTEAPVVFLLLAPRFRGTHERKGTLDDPFWVIWGVKCLPCLLHLLDVSLCPGAYSSYKLDEGSAEISQRVLHTRGNAGVKAPADDSIALQAA